MSTNSGRREYFFSEVGPHFRVWRRAPDFAGSALPAADQGTRRMGRPAWWSLWGALWWFFPWPLRSCTWQGGPSYDRQDRCEVLELAAACAAPLLDGRHRLLRRELPAGARARAALDLDFVGYGVRE